MSLFEKPPGLEAPASRSSLLDDVRNLRAVARAEGRARFNGWRPHIHRAASAPAALNLAHYLSLRHRDLRPLQRGLMRHGFSSLGRLEGRVLATLDAVEGALAAVEGVAPDPRRWPPAERRFFRGETALGRAAEALFGPPQAGRAERILVTLPSEAADGPAFILGLARSGADAVRINCAHDDTGHWVAMAGHTRAASQVLGRHIAVLMDIAGPKLRTGAVRGPDPKRRLQIGDQLILVSDAAHFGPSPSAFQAVCEPGTVLDSLKPDASMAMDDGKLAGVVAAREPSGAVVVHVTRVKLGGVKLKSEKGLNFPDSALGMQPLSDKDLRDLDCVAAHADMVGYSFVQGADDIVRLQRELARRRPDWQRLGLVAKIETREAVRNLPEIIVRAAGQQPFAVMIARGDLAVEIGFARLAEVQEEILWLCEAAHVPVIWATQVLESMVKSGLPTRGEMTDAAMAVRAECVMLNKGAGVTQAIAALDGLLRRMAEHQAKRRRGCAPCTLGKSCPRASGECVLSSKMKPEVSALNGVQETLASSRLRPSS